MSFLTGVEKTEEILAAHLVVFTWWLAVRRNSSLKQLRAENISIHHAEEKSKCSALARAEGDAFFKVFLF